MTTATETKPAREMFTPGPWKLKRESTIADANGDLIATTGYRVTAIDDQDGPNARLITASPCLYAALLALSKYPPGRMVIIDEADVFAARAALAKARGEAR